MAKWLSAEWMDEYLKMAQSQPSRPGATAAIQFEILNGPSGNVFYYWIVEDGKLVECKLGELDEPEVVLSQEWNDAIAIQKCELDATAAFMQGKIKVTGNMGKLMALLPITTSDEYRDLQTAVAAVTEF